MNTALKEAIERYREVIYLEVMQVIQDHSEKHPFMDYNELMRKIVEVRDKK